MDSLLETLEGISKSTKKRQTEYLEARIGKASCCTNSQQAAPTSEKKKEALQAIEQVASAAEKQYI